jgi:hypothetical protein
MQKIFGANAAKMDLLLIHNFKKNFLFGCKIDPNSYPFQEFVEQIKENIKHHSKDETEQTYETASALNCEPSLGYEMPKKKRTKLRKKAEDKSAPNE